VSSEPKEKIVSFSDPRSPYAEAFRTLRTNLSFSGVDKPYRTILITSTFPAEGKSSTCANLGVVMAQAGQRVVILDCDLRKPTQHKIFNLTSTIGVTNIVVSDMKLDQVAQPTEIENLHVVTSGPIPPNPSELVGSKKMAALISTAGEAYDIVLVDSPPVVTVTDASLLSTMVDGVLLLVKTASTKIEMVQESKALLERVNAKIIGVILNQVDANGSNYYYQYYYYYGDRDKRKLPGVAM